MARTAAILLAVILVACGQQLEQTPGVTPAATSSATPLTAARLNVEATVEESCRSFGGCVYFVAISGVDPLREVELIADEEDRLQPARGLPSALAAGKYTLTLTYRAVSDAIVNGHRQMGAVAASCSVDFVVSSGQESVNAHGRFNRDECSVKLTG